MSIYKKPKFKRRRNIIRIVRMVDKHPDICRRFSPNELRKAAGLKPIQK